MFLEMFHWNSFVSRSGQQISPSIPIGFQAYSSKWLIWCWCFDLYLPNIAHISHGSDFSWCLWSGRDTNPLHDLFLKTSLFLTLRKWHILGCHNLNSAFPGFSVVNSNLNSACAERCCLFLSHRSMLRIPCKLINYRSLSRDLYPWNDRKRIENPSEASAFIWKSEFSWNDPCLSGLICPLTRKLLYRAVSEWPVPSNITKSRKNSRAFFSFVRGLRWLEKQSISREISLFWDN